MGDGISEGNRQEREEGGDGAFKIVEIDVGHLRDHQETNKDEGGRGGGGGDDAGEGGSDDREQKEESDEDGMQAGAGAFGNARGGSM